MSNLGKFSKRIKSNLSLPLKEPSLKRDMIATCADATQADEITTQELPDVDIAQQATQTGLYALSAPFSPSFANADTTLISDQQTWKLPVVSGPAKGHNRERPSETQKTGGENYRGLLRNLVKSSGIYAISSLTSPLVSLLLLPFVTHSLSHTDYGALAVLNTAIALVCSITTIGVDAVFARTYSLECKTRREQLDAISTLTLLLSLIMLPVLIVGVLFAPWLSTLLLNNGSYRTAIFVSVLLVPAQNLTIPGLIWLRVERRPLLYSITSIANCLIVAAATIILVGPLHMGIVGALVAVGLGNLMVAACTLPPILFRAGFHLRLTVVVSMLALGVPYAVNYVTTWVLQLSDRYLLGHLASLSAAASYSIAYTLGGAVALVITRPFSLVWWVYIYPISQRDDAPQVFKLIFRWYSFLLLFATLGLALIGESFLDILFPASYHGQSLTISIVALSTVFNSIFTVFNLGMNLRRKTWLASIALIFSALLNIGANLVLIPLYGAMGAALATLIAYIALALVSYLFNQRIYPVPFQINLFLVVLIMGIILYFVDYRLVQGRSDVIAWGIHITLLLLYGSTLAILGMLPWHKKRTLEEKLS